MRTVQLLKQFGHGKRRLIPRQSSWSWRQRSQGVVRVPQFPQPVGQSESAGRGSTPQSPCPTGVVLEVGHNVGKQCGSCSGFTIARKTGRSSFRRRHSLHVRCPDARCAWVSGPRLAHLCCCLLSALRHQKNKSKMNSKLVSCFLGGNYSSRVRAESCARSQGRRGFTRQPENSKRAHLSAPALQTQPKFHEKTPRDGRKARILRRESEKKTRNFGPHPSGPTLSTHQRNTSKKNQSTPKNQTTETLTMAKVGLAKVRFDLRAHPFEHPQRTLHPTQKKSGQMRSGQVRPRPTSQTVGTWQSRAWLHQVVGQRRRSLFIRTQLDVFQRTVAI